MKITYLTIIIAAISQLHAGLISVGEHVDIRWRWETPGGWNCQAVTGSNGGQGTQEVFFPLSDKPYVTGNPAISGSRFSQPTAASFAFTGVPAGLPLWIAVQGTPGIGEAWPGLENNQPAGTFGSYIPGDLRVSQTTARPWIKISLVGYTHPGTDESYFSLWNTSTGSPPIVWMSTYDPSVINDYYYAEGSHTHMNWGFSALGIHRITLRASAFAGPGASNPTGSSAEHRLTFAIGEFARWQAASFTDAELDEVTVSGPSADPDEDGTANLLEFAFGLDPKSGATTPVSSGLGLPELSMVEENGTFFAVLKYAVRRVNSQLTPLVYSPMFSTTLSAADWTSDEIVTTANNFSGDQAALNSGWQKITVRRNLGAVPPTRIFARVGVAFSE